MKCAEMARLSGCFRSRLNAAKGVYWCRGGRLAALPVLEKPTRKLRLRSCDLLFEPLDRS
jgi:hypothetical protein